MQHDELDAVPAGDPVRDPHLRQLLALHEASYLPDDLALARQRQRIATAVRARHAQDRLAAREPAWWEWVARAARPAPMSAAAMLLIAALAVLRTSPGVATAGSASPEAAADERLASIVAGGGGGGAVMDLLVGASTPDSLLARAYPGTGAAR